MVLLVLMVLVVLMVGVCGDKGATLSADADARAAVGRGGAIV
jgi:hypothetical protein